MKIGFIGIGHMGGAILSGYAASQDSKEHELFVFDPSKEACRNMKLKVDRVKLCGSIEELCGSVEFIVIGVKPQIVGEVLEEIASAYRNKQIVISMVTGGVSLDVIGDRLGADAKIVRIMPNTPAEIGEAMTAICKNRNVTESEFQKVSSIFRAIGAVEEIDEALMGCAGGISGSSPAYTYMYIEALIQSAVEYGMSEEKARVFASQAVLGAAKVAMGSKKTVEELREDVCSPNGVTIEAVNVLKENGFMEDIREGFRASMKRFVEINAENE